MSTPLGDRQLRHPPVARRFRVRAIDDGTERSWRVQLVDSTDQDEEIGPTLPTSPPDDEWERAHVAAIFGEDSQTLCADSLDGTIGRIEQLVVQTLHSGAVPEPATARARIVCWWSALVTQRLVDRLERSASGALSRRLDRVVALISSDAVQARSVAAVRRTFPTEVDREARTSPKTIKVHPFRNRWAIFEEIGASIALTTLAAAASFVFLGVTLGACGAKQPVCDATGATGLSNYMDVVALFVCSFGFLFATLAYANATGALARWTTLKYDVAIERGNRLSEYFGVYFLLYAIPITVERALTPPVPQVVALIGLSCFIGYHRARDFSLLERHIGDGAIGNDRRRDAVLWGLTAFLAIGWFAPWCVDELGGDAQLGATIRLVASVGFFVSTVGIMLSAAMLPTPDDPRRFEVHEDDPGDDTLL